MIARFAVVLGLVGWATLACASRPDVPGWAKRAEQTITTQTQEWSSRARKLIDLPRIEQAANQARELWRIRDHIDIAALPALSAFELQGPWQSLVQSLLAQFNSGQK